MPSTSGRLRARALAYLFLAAVTPGCTSSHRTTAAAEAAAPSRRRLPNVITHQELATTWDRNAYQAIQRLRPTMLKDRGPTSILLDSPRQPEVYVDGMFYGRFASLQQIQASDCWEIRYLNVGEATIRYGPGHTAGVIDITTKH